jgi:hypothetical protein
MTANALAKNYGSLTPEERFRLILAARGRGDEAERDRLVNAGQRITLSMQDHAPYAHAFDELALLIFIELLEESARYFDAWKWADDDHESIDGEDNEEEEGDEAEEGADAKADADLAADDGGERPAWQRSLDLALAAGFVLKTKAGGWKRFCERLNVLPFRLWEGLPGFDRLQRALALAEGSDSFPGAAFTPEGMLSWLNAVRPAGELEHTEIPLTVERMADSLTKTFRESVVWWGG